MVLALGQHEGAEEIAAPVLLVLALRQDLKGALDVPVLVEVAGVGNQVAILAGALGRLPQDFAGSVNLPVKVAPACTSVVPEPRMFPFVQLKLPPLLMDIKPAL